MVGSDSFNHVFRPTNSPVANKAAPGAAVANGEGVPSAGASYTAGGYLQQPLRASRAVWCLGPLHARGLRRARHLGAWQVVIIWLLSGGYGRDCVFALVSSGADRAALRGR